MKTRTISIATILPASIDTIWENLQQIKTLQYIAAPYAYFKSVGNRGMEWKEGEISQFYLKVFGFLPLGVHTIKVVKLNRKTLEIFTNESNRHVPVWNHRILLKEINDNSSHYIDEIEIGAGWKTHFIVLWSLLFYKHRQRKWIRLLQLQRT